MSTMNRREAIAAALSSMALPGAVIGEASIPSRVYSVMRGDRGRVWLDGKEVKAVACYPGNASGWAECLIDKQGRPLGMNDPPVIVANRVFKRRFFGRVLFARAVDVKP